MFTDWKGVRCLGQGTHGPGGDETDNLRVHIGPLVFSTEKVMSALSAWVAVTEEYWHERVSALVFFEPCR